jgi:hypothetical protein
MTALASITRDWPAIVAALLILTGYGAECIAAYARYGRHCQNVT